MLFGYLTEPSVQFRLCCGVLVCVLLEVPLQCLFDLILFFYLCTPLIFLNVLQEV